jgi:hypothetical protein
MTYSREGKDGLSHNLKIQTGVIYLDIIHYSQYLFTLLTENNALCSHDEWILKNKIFIYKHGKIPICVVNSNKIFMHAKWIPV